MDNSEDQVVEVTDPMVEGDTSDLITQTAPEDQAIMITGNEEISGDFDSSDIDFPRMGVAQSVGPLSEDWVKGDIVIDKDLKIGDIDNPIEFTILSCNKRYVEDLPYGGSEIPRTFNSKEEVYGVGGTVTWSDAPPTFKAVMDCLIAIKHNEKEWVPATDTMKGKFKKVKQSDETHPFIGSDGCYLFAMWRIKGASYKSAAKPINQAAKFFYRKSLMQGTFMLNTVLSTRKDGSTYASAITKKGNPNSEERIKFLKEFTL